MFLSSLGSFGKSKILISSINSSALLPKALYSSFPISDISGSLSLVINKASSLSLITFLYSKYFSTGASKLALSTDKSRYKRRSLEVESSINCLSNSSNLLIDASRRSSMFFSIINIPSLSCNSIIIYYFKINIKQKH